MLSSLSSPTRMAASPNGRPADAPPYRSMLCKSSVRGDGAPEAMAAQTSWPSRLVMALALPPPRLTNVGSQSLTWTRPERRKMAVKTSDQHGIGQF